MPKDLYLIPPSSGVEFHVGRTSKGRQVILGALLSDVVAYMFDSKGRLLSRECRPRRSITPADILSFQQSQDSRSRIYIDYEISRWRRLLDIKEEPIAIEEFFDADLFAGVQRIPACLEQAAKNETESEYQERCSERDAWIESGRFVFWWTRDYWFFRDSFSSAKSECAESHFACRYENS